MIEEKREAVEFWRRHFPFMFAVHSDYDYLAVDLSQESYGTIVSAFAPEFEVTCEIAPSFETFLVRFCNALDENDRDENLWPFMWPLEPEN